MLKKYLNITTILSSLILLISFFLSFPTRSCMSADVSTGVEKLELGEGRKIEIFPNVDPQCIIDSNDGKDVLCFPHSTMKMTVQEKAFDLTNLISKWDECYVYFVKIRKDKYLADLNNDGKPEIAILPMLSGGGAWYLTAYLFTVTDQGLVKYGIGRFAWELGEHVLLGCPKCWKFDLKQCKNCY